MKTILEKGKREQGISGKCAKIIVYKQPSLYCGLISVDNSKYFNYFLKLDQDNDILKLRPKQDYVSNYQDMIEIQINGMYYLVQCNNQGEILICQQYVNTNQLQFKMIFKDNCDKLAINALAFLQSQVESHLFYLDQNQNLNSLKIVSQKFEPKYNILSEIEFMIPQIDYRSILLIDKQRRFIFFNQDSFSKGFTPITLEINSEEMILLGDDKNNILKNIISVDYTECENGYNIYIVDQHYLYKFNYIFGNSSISIKQILHINQQKGAVQKIFTYPHDLKYSFEVAIVQQKSIDQYQLTKEFKCNNLWSNKDQQEQFAFDYLYERFGTKYVHMVHHISYSKASNPNNNFKYDPSKGFIQAFTD